MFWRRRKLKYPGVVVPLTLSEAHDFLEYYGSTPGGLSGRARWAIGVEYDEIVQGVAVMGTPAIVDTYSTEYLKAVIHPNGPRRTEKYKPHHTCEILVLFAIPDAPEWVERQLVEAANVAWKAMGGDAMWYFSDKQEPIWTGEDQFNMQGDQL